MKIKILYLLSLIALLYSCGGNPDAVIPDETVGKSTIVITGAISATLEYKAEFIGTISTAGDGISGYTINLGNTGQTESALVFTLDELGNKQGFAPGTFNYTNDPNTTLAFWGIYTDANDTWTINPTASLTNKIVLNTITDTKVTGEFELNLESSTGGDKIKLVGTFEAVGETIRS